MTIHILTLTRKDDVWCKIIERYMIVYSFCIRVCMCIHICVRCIWLASYFNSVKPLMETFHVYVAYHVPYCMKKLFHYYK